MHTGTLRKWALALTLWLALHSVSLRAQTFTAPLQASTTGTNPVDFEFRADGTLIAKGNFGVGSLLSTDQGAGTRMLWFPDLGSFRAGQVSGTYWDASSMGLYSVAFGYDTGAYGKASFATGAYNTASAYAATALGGYNTSSGAGATTMGAANLASGSFSTAMGAYTTASGYSAAAWGVDAIASGSTSTASGLDTVAASYLSFVIGTYNVGGGSATSWVATDPIFEIGNGTSTTPSDAFVVYKNGNASLQGTLDVAPGGDIPMYSGE